MTKKEMKKLINECIEQYKKIDDFWDKYCIVFGSCPENLIFDTIWSTFDKYLDTVEKLIGDDFSWVNWYIYDNDCGKNEYEAKASNDKKMRKIKTVEQLVNLIMKDK